MNVAVPSAKLKQSSVIDSELVVWMKDEKVFQVYCDWKSDWNF